ncbi:MAG: hypothetical protein K2F69_02120 [Bacteroidaceae bacterium]|nr:hypothetical protein [Bacteroidaceae bacterium]
MKSSGAPQKVKLALNKMQCLHGVDSAYIKNTFFAESVNSSYKILIYKDATSCTPCAIDRMYAWNDMIKQFDKYNVRWIFIISPQKEQIENMYLAIEYSYLKSAIYVDTANIFPKENEHIMSNAKDQVMLIDKDNKIIVIGNPMQDINVQSNMIKILQEKSSNN